MNFMNNFYYACSYPLEVGSVIKPGNWSRILKLYTPSQGNPWVILREKIFEDIRLAEFSTKPSRWESLFLCESEEGIREFVITNNRVMDLLYEVELVDFHAPRHKGCLIIQGIHQNDNYLSIEQKAYQYWRSENIQKSELVTSSPIRILRLL
jgi:hypothetical protein